MTPDVCKSGDCGGCSACCGYEDTEYDDAMDAKGEDDFDRLQEERNE